MIQGGRWLVRYDLSRNMLALRSPFTVVFIFLISKSTLPLCSSLNKYAYRAKVTMKKCCSVGYVLSEELNCIKYASEESGDITGTVLSRRKRLEKEEAFDLNELILCLGRTRKSPEFFGSSGSCTESMLNGAFIIIECSNWDSSRKTAEKDGGTNAKGEDRGRASDYTNVINGSRELGKGHHSSNLASIVFWGAQTYMSTNIAHVFLCTLVVLTYLVIPELGKTLYDRAILRHNVCLMTLGCILTFLGYCDLTECPIGGNLTTLLWLSLQYFTISTVFWLNVICFDMTLAITRFRWMVGSGRRTDSEENRRSWMYGCFAWGGALMPTLGAAFFEFWPGIPQDFPLKPNYLRYRMGPSIRVNLYFFGIPLFTLFWNNVLFLFTTYKILRIQRTTEIATKSQSNALRKKYFLFLRLYLLMGAPWFFGSLFACLNKLVILKVCRLIQPLLWLLMLSTDRKLRRKLTDRVLRFIECRDL